MFILNNRETISQRTQGRISISKNTILCGLSYFSLILRDFLQETEYIIYKHFVTSA